MKEIDLLSLRYLVAVCDTGSVTGAATQEHIVASTISKRLGQLEEDFGVVLFERQQKRLRPTPAGETLLDHARALLSNASRVRDDMAAYRAGVRGQDIYDANTPDQFREFIKGDAARWASVARKLNLELKD